MSDIGIFMFGCVVFGLAVVSTMVLVLAPSKSERKRTLKESPLRDNL